MYRPLRLLLSLVVVVAGAIAPDAQKVVDIPAASAGGDVCETGAAEADLDAGGVRARLFNIGGLFWRGSGPTYEVPKGSGTVAIFAHGLWIGGLVGGDLRFAGSTYGPWEFWPGPLDVAAQATPDLCTAFDRIWVVTTADLAAYRESGVPTDDLAAWPVGAGAPFFVDADGDGFQRPDEPTVALRPGDVGYDPARTIDLGAGERPVVFGAQTAWWVMNDRGGAHDWSEEPALGLEIRVTAWTLADDSRPELYHSTFYRYDILNRSADTLENVFAGLFTDGDLGQFNDDFLHADSTRSMQVLYNGDEDDESSSWTSGYGVPPALGIDILSGGYAAAYFTSGGTVTSDPGRADEAYTFMRGQWKDGTPFKVGGDGYNTNGPPTRWLFSGEPGTFWSEDDTDDTGRSNTPADRRGMISAEIGRLGPGEETTLDVGLLFAQGGHRLDSVVRLKAASDVAQAAYASGDLFRAVAATGPPPPPVAPATAPTLLSPAPGASFDEGPVTFDWAPVDGATGYRVELSASADFEEPWLSRGPLGPREVPVYRFPPNQAGPVYWRVVPTTLTVDGPPSEARAISLPYRYLPGPMTYGDGEYAFVEVVGPGGGDPCGLEAASTGGCAEVFGNGIYGSANSTSDYVGTHVGTGPEGSIGPYGPNDFEIRFTEAGSFAYYPFTTGALIHVPFEVWDVGQVTPGQPNDPADDVQLIANLFADGYLDECAFGYADPPLPGLGPITQRIYAYYAVGDYDAFAAEAAPVVQADPDRCPTDPATAAVAGHIDFGRGRPLQRFVLEQASARGLDALMGTVIRFYTIDPITPAEAAPTPGTLALTVFPNPAGRSATVAYETAEAGPVALRVVDVLGRVVAVLAEGDRAAGAHRASVPTAGLAPGVYLVVLDAGGVRAVRPVTVVR